MDGGDDVNDDDDDDEQKTSRAAGRPDACTATTILKQECRSSSLLCRHD